MECERRCPSKLGAPVSCLAMRTRAGSVRISYISGQTRSRRGLREYAGRPACSQQASNRRSNGRSQQQPPSCHAPDFGLCGSRPSFAQLAIVRCSHAPSTRRTRAMRAGCAPPLTMVKPCARYCATSAALAPPPSLLSTPPAALMPLLLLLTERHSRSIPDTGYTQAEVASECCLHAAGRHGPTRPRIPRAVSYRTARAPPPPRRAAAAAPPPPHRIAHNARRRTTLAINTSQRTAAQIGLLLPWRRASALGWRICSCEISPGDSTASQTSDRSAQSRFCAGSTRLGCEALGLHATNTLDATIPSS
jgi:hypothetical protein